MKAVVITKAGGPEVLEIKELARKELGREQVRIAVKAAGVNRSDILTRENPDAYGGDAEVATIPGLEVAGVITEIGSEVTAYTVGDHICALVPGGGYSTELCIDARVCLPVPKGLDFVEAASLPEVLFTVWFNIFQQAHIKKGEGLLIHGGTSGIGVMGLQVAQALGIYTFTTVGSQEKLDFIKENNFGKVINYKKTDFEREFKDEKIDVILDMVGGDYTQKNLNLLAKNGRLQYINGMKSLSPTINLWTVMSKQIKLSGSLLKPQSNEVKAKIASELLDNVWPLIEEQKIKPIVYKTFRLQNAGEAHRLMDSSAHIGKIVLMIED